MDFIPKGFIDQPVEIRKVREDDVAAFVPQKTAAVNMRRGMSANVIRFFVERPVLVTEFLQPIACTQPRRSRSDDHNSWLTHGFSLRVFSVFGPSRIVLPQAHRRIFLRPIRGGSCTGKLRPSRLGISGLPRAVCQSSRTTVVSLSRPPDNT